MDVGISGPSTYFHGELKLEGEGGYDEAKWRWPLITRSVIMSTRNMKVDISCVLYHR